MYIILTIWKDFWNGFRLNCFELKNKAWPGHVLVAKTALRSFLWKNYICETNSTDINIWCYILNRHFLLEAMSYWSNGEQRVHRWVKELFLGVSLAFQFWTCKVCGPIWTTNRYITKPETATSVPKLLKHQRRRTEIRRAD